MRNRFQYLVLAGVMGLTGIAYHISRNDEQIGLSSPKKDERNVIEITDENFSDTYNYEKNWVLRFYQISCPFCNDVKPVFEETAKKYYANEKINFGQINVVKNQQVPDLFKFNVHPCILFIKKDKEVERFEGEKALELTEKMLEEKIEKYYIK